VLGEAPQAGNRGPGEHFTKRRIEEVNLKISRNIYCVLVLAALACNAHAGPVGPLTTFTAGTSAKASEVNANFSAVSAAVNDNAARIVTLETSVSGGNITLGSSTTTTGNILKGTSLFLHNFGSDNTFLGVNAGNTSLAGTENTAVGTSALQINTAGADNTATGAFALQNNTTGAINTATGAFALNNNTSGMRNTANGSAALLNNSTGQDNTALGANALSTNSLSNANTAVGSSALTNSSGANNTGVGAVALQANSFGNNNTAVGTGALGNNTTGGSNIAIGLLSGSNLTTGSGNIDIGNVGVAAESNIIRIGASQSATFIAGISGVGVSGAGVLVSASGQLGIAVSSRRFKDHIADMGEASGVLAKLRPVTFYYKNDKDPGGRTLQYGLVAEEVQKVAPGLVARSADGKVETVYYQFLAPMLLNEFQKQRRVIAAQAAELKGQRDQIARLERQSQEVAEIRQQLARLTESLANGQPSGPIASTAR
jgi:hypothetical protein